MPFVRLKSFQYAAKGILTALKNERHMRVHVLASLAVIGLGLFFQIESREWVTILLCIAIVVTAELFNSAIEELCDFIHSGKHDKIGRVKDVAAGAVFFSAIISFIIGLIIFLPHFRILFTGT